MRLNYLLAMCMVGLLSTQSHAINLKVSRQDQKLATQAMVEHDTVATPVVADDNRILDDEDGDSDGNAVTITTFLAQPDVARAFTITPGGTLADVKSGLVTISGTDLHGNLINEDFQFNDNHSGAVAGLAAFLTVTSIVFPVEDSPYGATWDVGVGDVLGLRRCLEAAGNVFFATLDGVYESTRPTIVQSTALAGNTADINGTLNGSKNVDIFYVQNFTCLP